MFWRFAHSFVKWFPPAGGGAYMAVMLFAATAERNVAAQALVDNQITMWRAIKLAPYGKFWLIFLLAIWLGLSIWTGQKAEAYRARGSGPPPDVHELGLELKRLSEVISRWLSDYQRTASSTSQSEMSMEERWRADCRSDSAREARFTEVFGAEIVAARTQMKQYGLTLPFHLQHITTSTMDGIAAHLGGLGRLLAEGKIDAARSMTDEYRLVQSTRIL